MARSRCSFTLPPQMIADLAFLSDRMRVSRSAILAELTADPLHDLRVMVEKLPPDPSPEQMLRFRGESERVVKDRLSALDRVMKGDDLFGWSN